MLLKKDKFWLLFIFNNVKQKKKKNIDTKDYRWKTWNVPPFSSQPNFLFSDQIQQVASTSTPNSQLSPSSQSALSSPTRPPSLLSPLPTLTNLAPLEDPLQLRSYITCPPHAISANFCQPLHKHKPHLPSFNQPSLFLSSCYLPSLLLEKWQVGFNDSPIHAII